MAGTSTLIEKLVADAGPVKRLRPPCQRAGLWLLAVGLLGAMGILLLADMAVFFERIEEPALALEFTATAVTGVAAVVAAFYLSLPDRSPAWALLPLPTFVVWIASSSYGCYSHWLVASPTGWELGQSAACLMFIFAFSVPLAASLLVMLHRSLPLAPVRVAAVGTLGVSALVAAALQFFHPFDVTFLDLGVHLATIGAVVAAVSAVEYFRALRVSA